MASLFCMDTLLISCLDIEDIPSAAKAPKSMADPPRLTTMGKTRKIPIMNSQGEWILVTPAEALAREAAQEAKNAEAARMEEDRKAQKQKDKAEAIALRSEQESQKKKKIEEARARHQNETPEERRLRKSHEDGAALAESARIADRTRSGSSASSSSSSKRTSRSRKR